MRGQGPREREIRPTDGRPGEPKEVTMTAVTNRIERSPISMTVADNAGEKWKRLRHEICQALGVLAVFAATAAAIIALRLLAYELGHEDLPVLREFGKLWN